MESVSLDSLQAISTCAPSDMFRDLRTRPATSINSFRMDKDFEHAMRGMAREVKKSSSPTHLSSNVLTSTTTSEPSLDDPLEEAVDSVWGQRYETQPSLSSFTSTKRNILKQNKGKGKTKLSKFGQYSAVVSKKSATDRNNTMPISELKLKEVQLISTLRKLNGGGNAGKGVSFIFGELNPTVEKYDRKNIPLVKPINNPADSDSESLPDAISVGTSSTAESSEYEEELATVLSRIQLASSHPSLKYQFGEELKDCDLVDATTAGTTKPIAEPEIKKKFVQRPQADQLLAIQDESLREAMERQRQKKESYTFW